MFLSDLAEEKVFLKEQTDNTEGKLNHFNYNIQCEVKKKNKNCIVTVEIVFPESTSGLSVGTANYQKELLVINFDLEPECPNAELRATLQWIAASELGIPTIYFKKSQENRIEKVAFTELDILLFHFGHSSNTLLTKNKIAPNRFLVIANKVFMSRPTVIYRRKSQTHPTGKGICDTTPQEAA